ncbi:MAG: transcriptional regulator NrdR [Armatimonadota bacterium]
MVREGEAIKRRRECLGCGRRYTTYEQIDERRVKVVKKDGRRESFDRQKVLRGLELAARKRPVSQETLEGIVDQIERDLYDRGEHEVQAAVVGEMVMDALRGIDPVAYVRFASVYRDFQDLTQFHELLDVLRPESRRGRPGGRRQARRGGSEPA